MLHPTPDSKVHGANTGPTGPRWAPCWPHEPCYLELNPRVHSSDKQNINVAAPRVLILGRWKSCVCSAVIAVRGIEKLDWTIFNTMKETLTRVIYTKFNINTIFLSYIVWRIQQFSEMNIVLTRASLHANNYCCSKCMCTKHSKISVLEITFIP